MSSRIILVSLIACVHVSTASPQRLETWNLISPSPRPSEFFGQTVAISGNWLAVNSYYGGPIIANPYSGFGQVHMFERVSTGWSWRQTIEAPDPTTASLGSYGRAMSMDGSTLIVCDPERRGQSSHLGATWVYEFDGAQWNLHQRLDRNDASTGQWADVDGDLIAVAAPYVEIATPGGSVEQGEVDVYERSGGHWNRTATLIPEDFFGAGFTLRFGREVRAHGDLLVAACARNTQHPTGLGRGDEVRAFQRVASGQWAEVAVLERPYVSLETRFGLSGLALDDEWIMVGDAPMNRAAFAPTFPPAVFAFRRVPAPTPTWALHQEINPSVWFATEIDADRFGYSIALSGNRMVVGAPYAPGGHGRRYYGQSWVFEFDGTQWVETERLSSTEVEAGLHHASFLGWSVDIDGPHIAVGDFYAPVGGPAGYMFGKAYVYEKDLGTPTCPGVPNNLGVPAILAVSGSDRAHVGFLDFTARSLPAMSPGVLFAGQQGTFVPNPGGSVGNLCITAGIVRAAIVFADAAGEWRATVPLPPAGATTGIPVTSGSTFHFQAWYRQPAVPATSNFTGALRIDFE